MAKKGVAAGAGAAPASNGNGASTVGVPNGYRQMSANSDAPWWKAEEGAVCHGTLLGFYTMQTDPPRSYYQLTLLEPAKAWKGKGNDREEVEVPKGGIINLGENFKIQELRNIIPEHVAGANFNVYVRVTGDKIKLSGGKTMWPMDVFSKMTKGPSTQVVRSTAAIGGGKDAPQGDDDVPF